MRVLCIPLVLALSGCGRQYDTGEFEPYVEVYRQAARDAGVDASVTSLVIRFGEVDGGDVGATCEHHLLQSPNIIVSEAVWKGLSDASRELLMMHEFGHCLLGRGHEPDDSNWLLDRPPKSIMVAKLFSDSWYEEYRSQFLSELFGVR